MKWKMLEKHMTPEVLGFIPYWLNEDNPKSAAQQINDCYQHGGGWRPFKGFKMLKGHVLRYPGDPEMKPLAEAFMREELVVFYRHAWVAVVQPNGDFEVARVD